MDSDDLMAPAPFWESFADLDKDRKHPISSVSSDDEPELANRYREADSDVEEQRRRRARKARKEEGLRGQEGGSKGAKTAPVEAEEVQMGARTADGTMGPPPPRVQLDPRSASTTRRRSPTPVASSSHLTPPPPAAKATTSRVSSHAPITSRAPPHPNSRALDPPPTQLPVVELSDSDSDIEVVESPAPIALKTSSKPAPNRPVRNSAPAPKVPASRTSSTAQLPNPPAKKGRKSGPQPPATLKEATERAKAVKPADLVQQFPTIGSYANYLNSFPRTPPLVFQGSRIAFVNFYDPSGQNALDKTHLLKMNIVATKGGILVAPESFVAAPPRGEETETEWAQRAEEEGWTTHVVVTEMEGRKPRYKDVLALLGQNGISEEELGGWVKIVRDEWVSTSSLLKERAAECFHEPPGRSGAPVRKALARVEEPDSSESGEEGDAEMQDGDRGRPVSPFGADDWPVGEAPPPGYRFDDLGETMDCGGGDDSNDGQRFDDRKHCDDSKHWGPNETTDSDPIEDPTLTARSSRGGGTDNYDDLRTELDLVHKFGDLVSDEALDEDLLYSNMEVDDFATDEEVDPSPKKPSPKKKKWTGRTYACDKKSTGGGAKSLSPNEHTASALDMLGKLTPKGSFRERGYRMAAGALRNRQEHITEYRDAVKIRGIGDKLAKKIVEICRTGTHRKLKLVGEKDKVVELLSGVYGIGTIKAGEYYDLGCRSLEDIGKVPGASLTDAMELGVKYYGDLAKRIPREEVTELYRHAVEAAKRIDSKLIVECMGSYRRGQDDCGDIDLLVTRDTSDGKDHKGLIKKLWSELCERGIIRHSLTNPHDWKSPDVKFNGLCALPGGLMRRIDILGVPWDEMPAALIYFTGNDFFNRSMRLKARHMGFRLNQRGLYGDVIRGDKGVKLTQGTKIDCSTEQAIFAKLGVTWRPATERRP